MLDECKQFLVKIHDSFSYSLNAISCICMTPRSSDFSIFNGIPTKNQITLSYNNKNDSDNYESNSNNSISLHLLRLSDDHFAEIEFSYPSKKNEVIICFLFNLLCVSLSSVCISVVLFYILFILKMHFNNEVSLIKFGKIQC